MRFAMGRWSLLRKGIGPSYSVPYAMVFESVGRCSIRADCALDVDSEVRRALALYG